MKKVWLPICLLSFLLLFSPSVLGKVEAAYLKFDQSNIAATANQTFQVQIIVDAGSEQIRSVDAHVLYDSTVLQAESVTKGTFFPTVTNNLTTGRVYVAGLLDDPVASRTGTGVLATITFKTLKDGSVTLTYDCGSSNYNTSKIIKNDFNSTNIIVCNQNGTLTVKVGNESNTDDNNTNDTTNNATNNTSNNSSNNSANNSNGSSSTTNNQTTMPKSGIIDNLLKYSVPGAILLIIGTGARLLL